MFEVDPFEYLATILRVLPLHFGHKEITLKRELCLNLLNEHEQLTDVIEVLKQQCADYLYEIKLLKELDENDGA